MDGERTLPADFGARLRAARAYKDDIGRDDFAEELSTPGASASTIKAWELGRGAPGPLAAEAFVRRVADFTGLPESFFWATETGTPSVVDQRLSELRDQLAALRIESEARDLEVLRLLGAGQPPDTGLPPPPQQ